MSVAISGNSMQKSTKDPATRSIALAWPYRKIRRYGRPAGLEQTDVAEIQEDLNEQNNCCREHQAEASIRFRRCRRRDSYISLTDCDPVVSGKQMLQSICGPKRSPRALRCESGSGTILLAGTNFDVSTRMKYTGIATASANCAPSLRQDELHLFCRA
jgi:hypothetical protein